VVGLRANDDRLWARLKDTIRLFLRAQWRGEAPFGQTEDQAFFITCDRTVMSQDDILRSAGLRSRHRTRPSRGSSSSASSRTAAAQREE